MMKAIYYSKYGSAAVLSMRDVEKPLVNDDQVLIKVNSVGLNPLDWHYMRGEPFLVRLPKAIFKPKLNIVGADVSGIVEEVGKNVKEFEIGDAVIAMTRNACAEYIAVRAIGVVAKPANISFAQGSAIPIAAITALQSLRTLRDKGSLAADERILINGASGGVGTFAIQIAKYFGAHVTGVCSTRNLDLVRSIGADEVFDYTKFDFTKSNSKFDLILDTVGNHSILSLRRVMSANGSLVSVGGGKGRWINPIPNLIQMKVVGLFISQKTHFMMAKLDKADLDTLMELASNGMLNPVIDQIYPMSETAKAIEYLETGRARGKVIVSWSK